MQLSLSPVYDPWDPELARRGGAHALTSVEVTVSNRCNMRCRHCAVGETLVAAEPDRFPVETLFRRLDEVSGLQTLSITGGEPSASLAALEGYLLPILQYARARGLRTQINTNLTFELGRYELIAPFVDVFHISWNYTDPMDFHRIAWGRADRPVALSGSERLYERIVENSRALAAAGAFVSAESMINRETAPHLGWMNRFIAEMGCRRHEVHPMYPVDWAADLQDSLLDLDEYRAAVNALLDERDPDLWILFGTFPFMPCSPLPEDRALLERIRTAPNTTVRNCPDGRNRLNVDGFTGEIRATDFADLPPLGTLTETSLAEAHARVLEHPALAPYLCYCPTRSCTGPNPIVASMYHQGVDFRERQE